MLATWIVDIHRLNLIVYCFFLKKITGYFREMFLKILRYAEFYGLNLLINQIERLRLLWTVWYRYTKCDVVDFWTRHFLSSDLHLCEMVIYWWLSHLWHFLWRYHWRQPLFHPIGCICNPNRLYYCLLWCLYNHQSIKNIIQNYQILLLEGYH